MQQIYITPTAARQNFFNILSQVSEDGIEFVIDGRNLSQKISIIQKKAKTKKNKKKQPSILKLAGSLKSKVPYNPHEKQIARQIMAQEYAKKHL